MKSDSQKSKQKEAPTKGTKKRGSSPTWKIREGGKVKEEIEIGEGKYYFLEEKAPDFVGEPEVLSYSKVEPMLAFFGYSQKETASFLDVDPATISRWKRTKNEIGILRTKNMFEIDKIIATGVRIFGSEHDFKTWLSTSNPALGDVKPLDLLKNPYGVERVSEAINALSWGNYA